jgi:dTDP-4-dehydrorhamnose 3,5-epimerase
MIFKETPLPGAYVLAIERREDVRGFFARTWDPDEFTAHGLNPHVAQCSISFNLKCGTLRGMHYQAPPHAEAKLVRCTAGAIFDAIIDLRPDSPTYTRWFGITLSAENYQMLYVPEGFAHGFQTLMDSTEVFYQISAFYAPEAGRGVRWDDPTFGITWPPAERTITERDATYPDFRP